MDDHNLEGSRQVLISEMMMRKPNGPLIKKEMDVTFALRRKEVVIHKPAISQIIHRWPALFTESQVCVTVLSIYKKMMMAFYKCNVE